MTQKEKQLLLKDLCARLPYGVICDMWFERNESDKITEVLKCGGLMRLMNSEFNFIVKPYLRPMSSMTEEKKDEFRTLGGVMSHNVQNDTWAICAFSPEAYDWLNANHFDYRGLIPMGLALEAPEGMYKLD